MMALFNLRFLLAELLAAGFCTIFGSVSVDGPEVHEAEVPFPLSGELFEGCLGIWSFCRFLLEERFLEDEVFRFFALERLGLDSFWRRFAEDLRDERTFDRRDRFFRVTFWLLSEETSLSLSEFKVELELHPLDEGLLLSESEVELSSLLFELLLPLEEACRRLTAFLFLLTGAGPRMLNLTSSWLDESESLLMLGSP